MADEASYSEDFETSIASASYHGNSAHQGGAGAAGGDAISEVASEIEDESIATSSEKSNSSDGNSGGSSSKALSGSASASASANAGANVNKNTTHNLTSTTYNTTYNLSSNNNTRNTNLGLSGSLGSRSIGISGSGSESGLAVGKGGSGSSPGAPRGASSGRNDNDDDDDDDEDVDDMEEYSEDFAEQTGTVEMDASKRTSMDEIQEEDDEDNESSNSVPSSSPSSPAAKTATATTKAGAAAAATEAKAAATAATAASGTPTADAAASANAARRAEIARRKEEAERLQSGVSLPERSLVAGSQGPPSQDESSIDEDTSSRRQSPSDYSDQFEEQTGTLDLDASKRTSVDFEEPENSSSSASASASASASPTLAPAPAPTTKQSSPTPAASLQTAPLPALSGLASSSSAAAEAAPPPFAVAQLASKSAAALDAKAPSSVSSEASHRSDSLNVQDPKVQTGPKTSKDPTLGALNKEPDVSRSAHSEKSRSIASSSPPQSAPSSHRPSFSAAQADAQEAKPQAQKVKEAQVEAARPKQPGLPSAPVTESQEKSQEKSREKSQPQSKSHSKSKSRPSDSDSAAPTASKASVPAGDGDGDGDDAAPVLAAASTLAQHEKPNTTSSASSRPAADKMRSSVREFKEQHSARSSVQSNGERSTSQTSPDFQKLDFSPEGRSQLSGSRDPRPPSSSTTAQQASSLTAAAAAKSPGAAAPALPASSPQPQLPPASAEAVPILAASAALTPDRWPAASLPTAVPAAQEPAPAPAPLPPPTAPMQAPASHSTLDPNMAWPAAVAAAAAAAAAATAASASASAAPLPPLHTATGRSLGGVLAAAGAAAADHSPPSGQPLERPMPLPTSTSAPAVVQEEDEHVGRPQTIEQNSGYHDWGDSGWYGQSTTHDWKQNASDREESWGWKDQNWSSWWWEASWMTGNDKKDGDFNRNSWYKGTAYDDDGERWQSWPVAEEETTWGRRHQGEELQDNVDGLREKLASLGRGPPSPPKNWQPVSSTAPTATATTRIKKSAKLGEKWAEAASPTSATSTSAPAGAGPLPLLGDCGWDRIRVPAVADADVGRWLSLEHTRASQSSLSTPYRHRGIVPSSSFGTISGTYRLPGSPSPSPDSYYPFAISPASAPRMVPGMACGASHGGYVLPQPRRPGWEGAGCLDGPEPPRFPGMTTDVNSGLGVASFIGVGAPSQTPTQVVPGLGKSGISGAFGVPDCEGQGGQGSHAQGDDGPESQGQGQDQGQSPSDGLDADVGLAGGQRGQAGVQGIAAQSPSYAGGGGGDHHQSSWEGGRWPKPSPPPILPRPPPVQFEIPHGSLDDLGLLAPDRGDFREHVVGAFVTVVDEMLQLKYGWSLDTSGAVSKILGRCDGYALLSVPRLAAYLNSRKDIWFLDWRRTKIIRLQFACQELSGFAELRRRLRLLHGTASAVAIVSAKGGYSADALAAFRTAAADACGAVGRRCIDAAESRLQSFGEQDLVSASALEPTIVGTGRREQGTDIATLEDLPERSEEFVALEALLRESAGLLDLSGFGATHPATTGLGGCRPPALLVQALLAASPSVEVVTQIVEVLQRPDVEVEGLLEIFKKLSSWCMSSIPSEADFACKCLLGVPKFPKVVVATMRRVTSDRAAAEASLRFLASAARQSSTFAIELAAAGATATVCELLGKHALHKDVQRQGLQALGRLILFGGGLEEAIEAQGVERTLQALETYRQSANIQSCGLEVLRVLAEHYSSQLDRFGSAAQAAKRYFPREPSVHRAADRLLRFVVASSVAAVGALMDRSLADEATQRSGLTTLGTFAEHGGLAWRGASVTAMSRILRAMARYRFSPELVSVGLWALARLVERLDAPREGLEEATRKAREDNPSSSLVRKHAEVLEALLLRPS